MKNQTDLHWMAHALKLAERGRFTVSPNPCVGCVIIQHDQLIGEGFHQQAGCAHAEINALAGLPIEATRGATVYVTLEPCCHHGRTPPCTQALIAAQIKRVVIAQRDPNPLVAGQGIAQLRQAGIEVDIGVMQAQAEQLNRGFLQRMRSGLPRITVKMAASLDGRTALANGQSQWITGEASRQDVQYLRAQSCAIISSAATVLNDNARLTVRPQQWPDAYPSVPVDYPYQQQRVRQPLRVILDRTQRLPLEHAIFSQPGRTLWCVADIPKQLPDRVDYLQVPVIHDQLDLHFIVQALAQRQCNEVLVEAGPQLASSFIQQNLVDDICVYLAPIILGDQAKPLFYAQLDALSQAKRWQLQSMTRIDDDVRLTWSRLCSPD
jgi:diaminohydroxyphosphoribosylaminopyrimidine deaminase/5-amino-6-(5-phosphoribosylamino)uracil reductase